MIQADAGLYWQDSPDGEPEFVERITDCRCVPEGVITGREAVLRGEFSAAFSWRRGCGAAAGSFFCRNSCSSRRDGGIRMWNGLRGCCSGRGV
ncbi:MAG: hypothetical protein V8T87_15415 [Victivallales bacterium]